MIIAELLENLRQFPQDLDIHVMADHQSDLVDIASVHLITKPFTDEPFVVIEVQHQSGAIENRDSELQNPQHAKDDAQEGSDSPSTPKR